ncbi:dipeptide/oligopeptide/nickel ABC transporter ATP-binding protein [Bifidobacterium aemilianum]|uniref:Dipeptide/oligopeptide/nickel ABC transporter ATP-binding protein n=2 Tax=Bifidobacterium aemilianum TaxID=2493120 RepID=A0A366K9B2_9BIFI|nr:dipeptide/oligopeptide/nickel ABC transporter ATP-binding protein [Bifidobacterium aemilianum]
MRATPLLEGSNISKVFRGRLRRLPGGRGECSDSRRPALDGVSVAVRPGECLALIGGSGSGKSTLTRILLGLESPTRGRVAYRGEPVDGTRSEGYRFLRREAGLVFQNPFTSLDPRWTALRTVAEPLRIQARDLTAQMVEQAALEALSQVGLDPGEFAGRYPVDCSGGQAQRIAIARAIVANPKLIVADEPMSSLDVLSRLGILRTFRSIRERSPQTAIILVSHDLGLVQHLADTIMVLQQGRVQEYGPTSTVLAHPSSSYTKELIAAAS